MKIEASLAALLCAACGGTAPEPAPAATPATLTVAQALPIMQAFAADPVGEEARCETIIPFISATPNVVVMLNPDFLPWLTEPGEHRDAERLLLCAYMTGNAVAQLESGDARDRPLSGIQLVLLTYDALRARDPALSIRTVELLCQVRDAGELKRYVESRLAK